MEITFPCHLIYQVLLFIFILIICIYFLRVYEEGVNKAPPADTILPRDEFPKVELKIKK